MPRVTKVLNPSKRSGESDKGPWNIMEVEVEKDDGSIVKADTFDTVADGDIVELEPNNYTNPNTGKTYNGWNARIPKQTRKPSGGGADLTPVMEAIRMVFREVKEVKDQNTQIIAGIRALMGPPEEDAPAATPAEPAASPAPTDMPADFGLKEDDPRHPNNQPAATPAPAARDWQNVGRGEQESTPPEPTVEPIPDEPEDLASFMNG